MLTADCTLQGTPPYNCEGCDLTGASLAGKDLRNANFKNATLLGTVFTGAIGFAGADFTGAVMGSGTNFTGCDLTGAIFSSPANLGSDSGKPAVFDKAKLNYSVLSDTWQSLSLVGVTIVGLPQNLDLLLVQDCALGAMDFSHRSAQNAHFTNVSLQSADFTRCTLNNIVFIGESDLTGVKFLGAQIPEGVFDTSTLTRVDFSGATLTDSTFLQSRLDGTKFDGVDVTTCKFSSPPAFSRDCSNLTSFHNAKLNLTVIQKQWSFLDLSGATIVGLEAQHDLTYLQAVCANLSEMNLQGYTLVRSNLSGAILDGTLFQKAHFDHGWLKGAQGEKPRFDGADLTSADFSPFSVGGARTSMKGAVFDGATLDLADFTYTDFGPSDPKDAKTSSSFKGCSMYRVGMSHCNLSGAQLTGVTNLHEAVFTYANLRNADLSGAPMGSLSELFRLRENDPDYQKALNSLDASDPYGLAPILSKYKSPITPGTTTVKTVIQSRSWSVVDTSPSTTGSYQVLNWTSSDNTTFLIFSTNAHPAKLSYANLPYARLVDSNLAGVDASFVQLYYEGGGGGSTQQGLAGAFLDNINLSNANLGTLDLSMAELFGAVLSGSSLVNAKLKGAKLIQAKLDGCNLAGADFTECNLDGATLAGAAVAEDLSNANYGVHLFDISPSDGHLSETKSELINAADDVDFNAQYFNADACIAELKLGQMTTVRSDLRDSGVTFSDKAQLQLRETDVVWEIVDPFPPARQPSHYTLWTGYDDLGSDTLFGRPSIPYLTQAFHDNFSVNLRWQTRVSKVDSSGGDSNQTSSWKIDNDSEDVSNLSLGYMTFLARTEKDSSIAVFGLSIHHEQQGNTGMEIRILTYTETRLCRKGGCVDDGSGSYLSTSTICPNGNSFEDNRSEGVPWSLLIRAPKPPSPPRCVPSPYGDCPQSSARLLGDGAET